jgi:hypothetical protein
MVSKNRMRIYFIIMGLFAYGGAYWGNLFLYGPLSLLPFTEPVKALLYIGALAVCGAAGFIAGSWFCMEQIEPLLSKERYCK